MLPANRPWKECSVMDVAAAQPTHSFLVHEEYLIERGSE